MNIKQLQAAYLEALREHGPDSKEAIKAQDALIKAKGG